ncbi:MAG: hypothetical protein E7263_02975 [Lachnospiraceae bacterium]|nr:hypothetical protein [Lachnospiraceae bacterium]
MEPWNSISGKQKLIRTLILLPFIVVFIWFMMNFVVQPRATWYSIVVVVVYIWQLVGCIIQIVNER